MKKGQSYTIDLISQWDNFLRLENARGDQLAADDDSGGFPNARIVFKAPKDDTYSIIATCFAGVGDYVLTVRTGTDKDLERPKEKEDAGQALVGKQAPNLTGEFTINGEPKKLADLKGKVVLVDFWAVWCGPCVATFPHLRDWHKEFGKDLEIVGVTTYFEVYGFDKEAGKLKVVAKKVKDENTGKFTIEGKLKPAEENDMLKEFIGHHKLSHRILVVSRDNWNEASKEYGVNGIPHVALIDRKGVVRMVRVGASPQNAEDLHKEIKKLVDEK